jgi:AcrR family transcriptional regulator
MLTSIRSTKEKLLRAALTLVARDGFQAATTAAIADVAGVAEGTLYRHFQSKDDLLIEAYRRLKAEVFEAISDQDDEAAAPGERLKRLWRALFEAYRADTEAFRFGQRFGESALAKREGGAAHEAIASTLGRLWQAGVAAGEFKDLPADLLANLFFAPVGYMLKSELAGRRWSDADLDAAAQAVLDSWRA